MSPISEVIVRFLFNFIYSYEKLLPSPKGEQAILSLFYGEDSSGMHTNLQISINKSRAYNAYPG